jgi:hypothetical protein
MRAFFLTFYAHMAMVIAGPIAAAAATFTSDFVCLFKNPVGLSVYVMSSFQ